MGRFLPGNAAALAKTVFVPLVESAAAPGAILGPDTLGFGAAVTVRTSSGAAFHIVPVLAQVFLPVFAILYGIAVR